MVLWAVCTPAGSTCFSAASRLWRARTRARAGSAALRSTG